MERLVHIILLNQGSSHLVPLPTCRDRVRDRDIERKRERERKTIDDGPRVFNLFPPLPPYTELSPSCSTIKFLFYIHGLQLGPTTVGVQHFNILPAISIDISSGPQQ